MTKPLSEPEKKVIAYFHPKTPQDFAARMDSIESIEDAGEKFLKLEQFKARVSEALKDKTDEIFMQSRSKFALPFVSGMIGCLAITVVMVVTQNPWLGLFAFGSMGVGGNIGTGRAKKDENRRLEENQPFFKALEAQQAKAEALTQDLEKNHLPDLARSSKREELISRFPRIQEQFAKAFTGHTTPIPSAPVSKPPQSQAKSIEGKKSSFP